MDKPHRWEWIPLKSVGGIAFDKPLPPSVPGLELERNEEGDADDGELLAYRVVGGDTNIYVEDGVVEGIHCEDNFYFKGRNLIGLGAEEATEVIGGDWVLVQEDEEERIFRQDALEVMVWEEDGIVETIVVHGPIEDD